MANDRLINPIDRTSLTNDVIDALKVMILEGQIKPGDLLPSQTELAKGFRVGLSTVREAIRGLALIGVVDPQPGRGTRVSPDAPLTLRILEMVRNKAGEFDPFKVYEARMLIEEELTALAAERATAEDIAGIENALKTMRDSLEDDGAYAEADLAFHRAVADAAKSGLMADYHYIAHEMLSAAIPEVVKVPGIKENGLKQQEKILEAIRARDPERARAYTRENVGRWSEVYLRAFEQAD
jgi:GntR family transcriptional repressor for pyruvate dehydrogenase complex